MVCFRPSWETNPLFKLGEIENITDSIYKCRCWAHLIFGWNFPGIFEIRYDLFLAFVASRIADIPTVVGRFPHAWHRPYWNSSSSIIAVAVTAVSRNITVTATVTVSVTGDRNLKCNFSFNGICACNCNLSCNCCNCICNCNYRPYNCKSNCNSTCNFHFNGICNCN